MKTSEAIGQDSQIVLYNPDETISLAVKIDAENDTVWLTQAQMMELFQTSKQNVSLHINNIFKEGELLPELVVKESLTTTPHGAIPGKIQHKKVKLYNLDVIISLGYRVKSLRGTQFRKWANGVLKEFLFKGYAIHQQMQIIERRIDYNFIQQHDEIQKIKARQDKQQQQLDFFIRTSTPPAEMVFFEGDFYAARVALENLVKRATHRAIIIDAYVSAMTLDILSVRADGVEAIIYTQGVGIGMQRLMDEHDRLFPNAHIDIRKWRKESHDRWLIIDECLYHCGHSLNATGGRKISAITLMGTTPETILAEIQ